MIDIFVYLSFGIIALIPVTILTYALCKASAEADERAGYK